MTGFFDGRFNTPGVYSMKRTALLLTLMVTSAVSTVLTGCDDTVPPATNGAGVSTPHQDPVPGTMANAPVSPDSHSCPGTGYKVDVYQEQLFAAKLADTMHNTTQFAKNEPFLVYWSVCNFAAGQSAALSPPPQALRVTGPNGFNQLFSYDIPALDSCKCVQPTPQAQFPSGLAVPGKYTATLLGNFYYALDILIEDSTSGGGGSGGSGGSGGAGGSGGSSSSGGAGGSGGSSSSGGAGGSGGSSSLSGGSGGAGGSGGSSSSGGARVPVTYQAEDSSLTRRSFPINTQIWNDTKASGGAYVQSAGSSAVGDYIEFTIRDLAAATYDMQMFFESYSDRAIVQVSIDNVNQKICDEYSSSLGYQVECKLGTTSLQAVDHVFRFTVLDKNASSSGYSMTIDSIVLTNIGPPTTPPHP
jgi:hypothetical protein